MIAGQEDSAATLGVGTVNTASAAMMNANVDWASIHFLPLVFDADLRFHGRVVPAFDPRVPAESGSNFFRRRRIFPRSACARNKIFKERCGAAARFSRRSSFSRSSVLIKAALGLPRDSNTTRVLPSATLVDEAGENVFRMSHAGLLGSHIGHIRRDGHGVNRTNRAVLFGPIPSNPSRSSVPQFKVNEEGRQGTQSRQCDDE